MSGLRSCSSIWQYLVGAGGLYVRNGHLEQQGGRINMLSTNSDGVGGGLLIENGSLVQSAGDISCHRCRAERGGCLALTGKMTCGLHSHGSIQAENCVARSGPESRHELQF